MCLVCSSSEAGNAAGTQACTSWTDPETLVSACLLAGVYFEKYVKGRHGQSLWIRNLQLSIYGVPLSIAYTYLRDGRHAHENRSLHRSHAACA